MKLILSSLTFIFATLTINAQTFVPAYQERVNLLTQNAITTNLQEFAAFGVKTTGSTNNSNAFNWLKSKYASFGYTTSEIVEDPFTSNGYSSKNLVVTKTGTVYPNIFVIVSAHYDTVAGPGVNDNGSGTSIVLETAKILKNIPTEYSIKFIHFSGEEQGLLGSEHFVSNVVNATNPKMNIRLVLNLDQVGGVAGQVNNKVTCERDNSNPTSNNALSATKTQELITCVGLYSPLQTQLGVAYSSDYVPFQDNGEIITGLYESNVSNKPHTPNDTFANMDPIYVYNVGKATIGAVQHFAMATTNSLSTNEISNVLDFGFSISPNPATNVLHLKISNNVSDHFTFSLKDISGREILKSKNSKEINVSQLPSGNYIAQLEIDGKILSEKVIILR